MPLVQSLITRACKQGINPKSYVLKNKISKSDNNKRILAPNDYNKQHFLCNNLMSWPGLCESDNIKWMITLTVITLSGAYCTSFWSNLKWNIFKPVIEHHPSNGCFYLKQRKSHANAISGSLTKSQKCVWTPFGFLLRAKVIWVELFWVGIVLLIHHNVCTERKRYKFGFVPVYVA